MKTRSSLRYGVWLVAGSSVLWGTVGVAVRSLYEGSSITPLQAGFYRMALSVPALVAALLLLAPRRALRVGAADAGTTAAMGAMLALYQLCYFAAIERVGVAVATLVTLCTAPLLVALLSWLLLRERMTTRVAVALALALAGTALLVRLDGTEALVSRSLVGVALALGSAFGYAVVVLASRRLTHEVHPLQSTTLAFAFGSVALLPFALPGGLLPDVPAGLWWILVYLGVVPTALAYTLFVLGMRSVQATAASILTLLEPLTATLLAWLLFGERLGVLGGAGAGLLLLAIVLLTRR